MQAQRVPPANIDDYIADFPADVRATRKNRD